MTPRIPSPLVQSGGKDLRLSAVLIRPVQRLCRYPLLLDALLKEIKKAGGAAAAGPGDGEPPARARQASYEAARSKLELAAEKVTATAHQVNAMVTEAQNRLRVAEVHEHLRGAGAHRDASQTGCLARPHPIAHLLSLLPSTAPELIAPHRRLLLDAEVRGKRLGTRRATTLLTSFVRGGISGRGDGVEAHRLWLFTDRLLFGRPEKELFGGDEFYALAVRLSATALPPAAVPRGRV